MSATLAVTIALLVLTAYAVTLRSLAAATDRALAREAQSYEAAIRSAPSTQTLVEATRSYLRARQPGSEGADAILLVAVQGPGGRVISNSAAHLEDVIASGTRATPSASSVFENVRLDERTYRVLSVNVHGPDRTVVAIFHAALAVEPQTRTARLVAVVLTAAGLIALALGTALSLWTAGGALRPLQRMATDAEEVQHSEPGRRIAYDGPPDELGSLADSLNAMLDRLEAGAAEQRRFIADASHELRTPVAIIRGNVELLRSHGVPASCSESLAMIDDESTRMARLLDDLLALARLQGPRQRAFQPLHVPTIAEELASRARTIAGGRAVNATCSQPDLWVLGDPDLLEQALLNVVRNAAAHTADDGRIAIACTADGQHVRIEIADDGPGIPAEELPRIFDRFYRAQSAGRDTDSGGAGLGLAIASGLVELHGGSIAAENVEPHGARFTIELPRVQPPA